MSSTIQDIFPSPTEIVEELHCGPGGGADDFLGLRVASIFIILVGSLCGALFPILAHRSSWLHVPKSIFDFAKYFGSGVIIATAFIHLLAPALEALGSPCLSDGWSEYPYALAICLLSIFIIFIVELVAFRWGTAKLLKLGLTHDAHGHDLGSHAAHGPETVYKSADTKQAEHKPDHNPTDSHSHPSDPESLQGIDDSPAAQIVGIAILEFGVALHSVLIGLTLAVDPEFKILFVVLVFHQTFEGLAIGSRLAFMKLPRRYDWVPIIGACLYGLTTPVGIAVGLGIRSTYNPGTATASIVSGVLDAFSAGILIYTGLVELLAHEFLFNKEMMNSPNSKLAYAVCSMLLGCALMALLGRWA